MGSHSGSRKWFGLWTHTGRHSDTPVLEPDSGHTPEPEQHHGRHAARRRSEDATAAHTLPLDPVSTVTPDGRHRRSRVWTSAGLCAAVALVTTGAAALVQTQTDTQIPTRQNPITAGPRSSNPPSSHVPLADAERHTEPPDPLPGTRQGTSPESPSAAESEPRPATVPTVAPSTDPITSSPRPRVTVTETVPASPSPQPTVTVTQTRTRFLPLPRVTVTVTVPVPLPEPSG